MMGFVYVLLGFVFSLAGGSLLVVGFFTDDWTLLDRGLLLSLIGTVWIARSDIRGHQEKGQRMSTVTWGKPYGDKDRFLLADGRTVTMYRRRCRVRYYDEAGEQVGPEHANVVPALVWAWAQDDWFDPTLSPAMRVGIKREIAAGGTRRP